MPRPILLCLLLVFGCATTHAADFTLLNQLPGKVTAARAQSQPGWDTGNTSAMKEATYQYNNALASLINALASTYYPKDFLPPTDTADYLKALYSVRRFQQAIDNPSGESQGTLSYLDVPSAVSTDLEDTIARMVQAIAAQYPAFKYSDWQKKWRQALKS
ncbi:hypothetical protein BH09VER1_BH09VER1_54360 [soil metagenome]